MNRLLFVLSVLPLSFIPTPASGQSAPDSGAVVINELRYAPPDGESEFVELYNRSETAVNLAQLEIADATFDYTAITDTDTLLSPGAYVVLVEDPSAFASAFPNTDYLTPDDWPILNNSGDTSLLRHASSGAVIDSVPFAPSWGGTDGSSLERVDPAGPSDRAGNFGTAETEADATPGTQNSIFNPDTTPPTLRRARPTVSGDSIAAQFSEPVAHTTISASAVHLDGPSPPTVAETMISDTAATVVHVRLAAPLSAGSFTLVATDVSDRQGNVQPETRASFRYFDPAVPAPKDLVITEIMYAPKDGETEFIEIYNRSEKTVDLGRLQSADEDRDFNRITAPLTPLQPDSHTVLVRDGETFEATFPTVNYHAPAGWDALNNGGDTIILRHAPSGTTIDSVSYTPSWGGGDGRSLERIDPAAPSNAAFNFGSSTADAGATPGRRNSRYDPDERAPMPVFAEQVGEMTAEVLFSEPVQAASVTPTAFTLESTSVTDAGLVRDSVAVLSLADRPTGAMLRVEGIRDRVDNTQEATTLPLALRPDSSSVVINEILFDPRADDFDDRPNQVEYVEILNRTDRPLTLHGLFATDRPTEDGTADTLRTDRRLSLPARGYGLVSAAPKDAHRADSSQLARAFPDAPISSSSVAYLPVDAARLGLGNGGDLVQFHRADGSVIAEVTYSSDWHAAGLEETKGTALERISPTGGTEAADNWTSSPAPAGGTPGTRNAVALPTSGSPSDIGLQIAPSPFSVERDGATRIQYTLDGVPNLVRARIFDARGRTVRTLEDARLTGRTGELVWNGRDDAGNPVRVGVYVVLFEAVRATEGVVSQFKAPVVVARTLD